MELLEEDILKTLHELEDFEFQRFQRYLRRPAVLEGLDPILKRPLGRESRRSVAHLMVQRYNHAAQKIMENILKKIHRDDLLDTCQGRRREVNNLLKHSFIVIRAEKHNRGYASAESQWKIEWQSSGKMKGKLMLTLFNAIK